MSLSLSPDPTTDSYDGCALPLGLIHGIEAAVAEADPQQRATAISQLVQEIHQTLTWLVDGQAGHPELDSFAEVVAAASAHADRMTALNVPEGVR